MAKSGKGRVRKVGAGETRTLSLPSKMTTDSQWPFSDGEEVDIYFEKDCIIARKRKPDLKKIPKE